MTSKVVPNKESIENQARTMCWFYGMMRDMNFINPNQLSKYFDEQGFDVLSSRTSFYEYSRGETKPTAATIDAINLRLPNSKAAFCDGPENSLLLKDWFSTETWRCALPDVFEQFVDGYDECISRKLRNISDAELNSLINKIIEVQNDYWECMQAAEYEGLSVTDYITNTEMKYVKPNGSWRSVNPINVGIVNSQPFDYLGGALGIFGYVLKRAEFREGLDISSIVGLFRSIHSIMLHHKDIQHYRLENVILSWGYLKFESWMISRFGEVKVSRVDFLTDIKSSLFEINVQCSFDKLLEVGWHPRFGQMAYY